MDTIMSITKSSHHATKCHAVSEDLLHQNLCLHGNDSLPHLVIGDVGETLLVLEVLSVSGLTFPAGAEVQFPGCLFPVDVRYVLGLGPPQTPPRPARGSPPPLGLVIGRRRLSRLLEDLFIG